MRHRPSKTPLWRMHSYVDLRDATMLLSEHREELAELTRLFDGRRMSDNQELLAWVSNRVAAVSAIVATVSELVENDALTLRLLEPDRGKAFDVELVAVREQLEKLCELSESMTRIV